MRPDSDLDLLVDFLPGARPGLPGVSAMMREFTALAGRRVDLAVKAAMKPLIRPGVLAEARLIYRRDQQGPRGCPGPGYSITSSRSLASTCCPGCTSNCFTVPATGA